MFHKRDRFGVLKKASVAYATFRYMRESGFFHPDHTWEENNRAYRKRQHKRKIARLSRRANRGK